MSYTLDTHGTTNIHRNHTCDSSYTVEALGDFVANARPIFCVPNKQSDMVVSCHIPTCHTGCGSQSHGNEVKV